MSPDQTELANAIQQALRAVLIALVAELHVDPGRVSVILAAQASNPQLEPVARLMLDDLAEGLAMMSPRGHPPQ